MNAPIAPNWRTLQQLPPQAAVAAMELARRHVGDFASFTWADVHRPLLMTPFHRKLAEILEQAAERRQNIILSTPPQHGKSTFVSVAFPAWWLGRHPGDSVILTSYAASLAYRNSRAVRDVVEGAAFRMLYPDVGTDPASRAVDAWKLAPPHTGQVVAAGVGGPITGHGAELGIIDDPFENWMQAQSKTYRDRVWDWFKGTFRTRIHENGVMVLISTRWHPDDLIGRLLKHQPERWVYYNFQAVYEGNCGRDDPLGRKIGEPLAPALYSLEALRSIEEDVGPRVWEAEYQGCPMSVSEVLLDVSKLQIEDDVPDNVKMRYAVRYWDLAASDAPGSSYTTGLKLGVDERGEWWVLDIARTRSLWPQTREMARQTLLKDGPSVVQGIENVGFQRAAYDDLRSLAPEGYRIRRVKVVGDKASRTVYFSGPLAAGKIHVLRRPWTQAFLDELREFPHGANDDQVDALSGAAYMLRRQTPQKARSRSWA